MPLKKGFRLKRRVAEDAERRGEETGEDHQKVNAGLLAKLCSAIRQELHAPRGFSWSADSLVRESLVVGLVRADKAVRAPLSLRLRRAAFLRVLGVSALRSVGQFRFTGAFRFGRSE
jgi:hypothetical protein